MVEFALVLPALALISLGVVDLARVYSLQVSLRNAARVGADYAQYYPLAQQPSGGSCNDPNNVRYQVYSEAGTTNVTVLITPTEVNGCQPPPGNPTIPPGCPIKVDVSQRFDPITPLITRIIGDPVVHGTVTINTQGGTSSGACPAT